MMSSQLGRMILGGSTATEDEMRADPDEDGGYGPLDDLLTETAARLAGSEKSDDRRPGSLTKPD